MSHPPPPPPPLFSPPPPPPLNVVSHSDGGHDGDRNALLSAIRQGTKLKKTSTNDRSAPIVNSKTSTQPSSNKNGIPASNASSSNITPMNLGGLFAQGMPKLRPTNQSFLQGGSYKSQLSPRTTHNSDISLNFPSPSMNGEKNSSKMKLSSDDVSKSSTLKSSLFQDNTKPVTHFGSLAARPSPPPPKTVFQGTLSKSFVTRGDLKKGCDYNLGGSEPDLSANLTCKPRSSSKPLPPPKFSQLSSATSSPVKSCDDIKQRSYEDSDVTKKMVENNGFEKSGIFTLARHIPNNRSEPSNLNKISQNVTTQLPVAPLRQHNRRPVKPTTAPPPLPTRLPAQSNVPNDASSTSLSTRDLPPAPQFLPPPPPPPPRVLQHNMADSRITPSISNNKPTKTEITHVSNDTFETRFKFHKQSELPYPSTFTKCRKIYQSKMPTEPSQQKRRARQPPPPAPPPPPPNQMK